jgi:hypothetical protein
MRHRGLIKLVLAVVVYQCAPALVYSQGVTAVSSTCLMKSTDDWCCVSPIPTISGVKLLVSDFAQELVVASGDTLRSITGVGSNTLLMLTDADNVSIWRKTFNLPTSGYVSASGIVSKYGQVIAVVHFFDSVTLPSLGTFYTRGKQDVLLLRYDAFGAIVWSRQIGTVGYDAIGSLGFYQNDSAVIGSLWLSADRQGASLVPITYTDVIDTSDITTNSKYGSFQNVVFKLDATGTLEKYFNVTVSERGVGIANSLISDSLLLVVNSDDPYFIIDSNSFYYSHSGSALATGARAVVAVDGNGNYASIAGIQGVAGSGPALATLELTGALPLNNGNLAIIGFHSECKVKTFGGGAWIANDPFAYNDAFLAVTDRNGKVKWSQTYATSGSDAIWGLQQDENSNIYVAGGLGSAGAVGANETLAHAHAFIAKYDSLGNCLWSKQGDGTGIAGTYNLARLDDGALDWQIRVLDGNYTIDGITAPGPGVYTFRLRDWPSSTATTPTMHQFAVYPNPATKYFYIDNAATSISIVDLQGRVLVPAIEYANAYCNKVDCSALANGIYSISALVDGKRESKRLVINN